MEAGKHHVMARGLGWCPLFWDARDRADLIARLPAGDLGLLIARVARALGISPTVVLEGVARGEALVRGQGLREGSALPAHWQQPS